MQELSRFITILLPDLSMKFTQFQIDPSIFASQWFITLFVYNMPFPFVARVWDLFFLKRWSVVFRISIALLEFVQEGLLQSFDMESILKHLKSISEQIQSNERFIEIIVERAMRLNVDENDARVLGNISQDEPLIVLND